MIVGKPYLYEYTQSLSNAILVFKNTYAKIGEIWLQSKDI